MTTSKTLQDLYILLALCAIVGTACLFNARRDVPKTEAKPSETTTIVVDSIRPKTQLVNADAAKPAAEATRRVALDGPKTRYAAAELPTCYDFEGYLRYRNDLTCELAATSELETARQDELRARIVAIYERLALCEDASASARTTATREYCAALAREGDVEGFESFYDSLVDAEPDDDALQACADVLAQYRLLARIYVAAADADSAKIATLVTELDAFADDLNADAVAKERYFERLAVPLRAVSPALVENAKERLKL